MSLSELVRGTTNHCKWCDCCDNIGNCSKIGRNVSWEIYEDKQVDDERCPKRRRKEK